MLYTIATVAEGYSVMHSLSNTVQNTLVYFTSNHVNSCDCATAWSVESQPLNGTVSNVRIVLGMSDVHFSDKHITKAHIVLFMPTPSAMEWQLCLLLSSDSSSAFGQPLPSPIVRQIEQDH